MKIFTFLCFGFAVLLAGCFGSDLKTQSSNLAQIDSLAQLCGRFENLPGGKHYRDDPALTDILFPSEKGLRDAEFVCVSPAGESAILCEVLRGETVLAKKQFTAGVDFVIEKGQIPLSSHASDLGSSQPQSLVLAAGSEGWTIALTGSGDIVLMKRSRGVGMVFMLVPIMIKEDYDYLFRRLDRKG